MLTEFWKRWHPYIWPKHGLYRTARFLSRRILRIAASPHAIAAGIASGVLVSFTPFIGLHFFLSFVVAYIVGGNMFAAAIGTAVGNPFTFPFIWSVTYAIGARITGQSSKNLPPIAFDDLWSSFSSLWPILQKMLIGGIPIGISAAGTCYLLTFLMVRRYQKRRALKRSLANNNAKGVGE